jgi:hypothetical protein
MTDYRLGKPKSKKITLADIDEKYLPEWFVEMRKDEHLIIDGNTAAQTLEAALNNKQAEQQRKLEATRHEEEQRRMAEREKQQREESKRQAEAYSRLPERQLEMLLSGKRSTCSYCRRRQYAEFFNHGKDCPVQTGTDVEPGLRLLQQEYSTGKIIRLDEQTRNRLVEFAKDDETWPDLMNRLLDIAIAAAAPAAAAEKAA